MNFWDKIAEWRIFNWQFRVLSYGYKLSCYTYRYTYYNVNCVIIERSKAVFNLNGNLRDLTLEWLVVFCKWQPCGWEFESGRGMLKKLYKRDKILFTTVYKELFLTTFQFLGNYRRQKPLIPFYVQKLKRIRAFQLSSTLEIEISLKISLW